MPIMKVLVLFAVMLGVFASEEECPPHQHYNECGTLCPVTCENYKNPPGACFLMCNPGCECDDGYVKAKNGSCFKPKDCSPEAEVCGENERYNECGNDCFQTCDNYDKPPKLCRVMCKMGCECEKGFVRRGDGKCVKPEQCPSRQAALDRPDCDKAPETGVCDAFFVRYYYDQFAGLCKKFVYGGCGGNSNNFQTEEECYNSCGALHVKSRNACEEDKEVGDCKAALARFFFNRKTGHCEPFIYGGCNGNSNNFLSMEDCEDVCVY